MTNYVNGYPWTTKEARAGHLIVVKATFRGYGYSLKNTRTNDCGMWFRRKADAQQKITDLIHCPNS